MSRVICSSCAKSIPPETACLLVGMIGTRICDICKAEIDTEKDDYIVLKDRTIFDEL